MALLSFLALQRDRSARREALAALLWEHADASQARATLRQAIATIRRLEDGGSPILLGDAEVLRLSDDVAVDIDRLRQAVRDSDQGLAVGDIYGSGLLSGFTVRDAPAFNEWLAIEQAHFRQQVVGYLTERADRNSEPGSDLNAGAETALKLLAIDPYNEAGHRALMRIYARQGRAALAIAQYRSLSDLLRRELQVPPEGETQRLHEQISNSRRDRSSEPMPSVAPSQDPGAAPPASSLVLKEAREPAHGALNPGADQPNAQPVTMRRKRGWRRPSLAVASAACLGALGVGAFTVISGLGYFDTSAPEIARLRPLVGPEVNPDEVALSPDGRQLAFSADTAQGSDLFLMNADGKGVPQRIARSDGDEEAPAWHPDGRSIAFVRHAGSQTEIVLKALPAGTEEVLATSAGRVQSLAWSPDGRFLLASASPGQERYFRLMRLDPVSGAWTALPGSHPGPFRDISPRISPDGTRVLFLRETSTIGSEMFVRDLATGVEHKVPGQSGRVWSAGWSKGGQGLIYGSEAGGESSLWYIRLDRASTKPQRLATGLHLYWALSISASGDKLAFVTSRTDPSFWRLPDDAVPGTPATRIEMLSGVGDRTPEQSIKGEIVFVSSRTGEEQVWKRHRDGSLQQLTRTTATRYDAPHWSPDGRSIAISIIRSGSPDVYVLDGSTGAARQLTRGVGATASSWAPDGHYVYFRKEGKNYEIWRVHVASGQASQVTDQGGVAGVPTRDGKALLYVKEDVLNVWRRALGPGGRLTGPETLLLSDLAGVAEVRGNALIYLARERRGGKALKRYDLATGKSVVMSRDADVVGTLTLSASPLGGILFERNEQRRDVSLIELE